MSDFNKLDTLLHKISIKVLLVLMYQGYQGMCRMCICASLSKIAHQVWCDHPFSQRNRTIERTVGVGVGGDREVRGGGWTKS